MDLAEEGKESQIQIGKKHLSRKIPRLDMILPEKEKEELIAYMRNRVNIVHILFPIHFYHPRMRVGNVFGHVCVSVCVSVCLCFCLFRL